MAEPYDSGLLPRTYFRAPRVPFDFRALTLGVLGFLVYWAGGWLISQIMSPGGESAAPYDVPGAFLAWAFQLFGGIPYIGEQLHNLLTAALRIDPDVLNQHPYDGWDYLVGGIWFIGVWSFFAQGIHRITTMRIARDEGLTLADALRFSFKNWPTVLLAPVIIAGIIGVFYVCNMAAGVLLSIPGLGGLLGLVLVPLAFISTLLMLLIGLGGIFGLPLIGAAAAWECNGSLDAISRAFSYLFARPLQFFWNFFLIFLFTGIIILVGSWFSFTFAKSVDTGVWHDTQWMLIDAPPKGGMDSDFAGLDANEYDAYDVEDIHIELYERNKDLYERRGIELKAKEDAVNVDPPAPLIASPAKDISSVGETPWYFVLNALLFWFFFNLIWLGVSGYALYWLIGASTSVYADLRADVDGTEEDEVYVEEEEQDLEDLAEAGPAVESEAAEPAPPAEDAPEATETAEAPPEDAADESPAEDGGDESA
jgi:hypothetical protein